MAGGRIGDIGDAVQSYVEALGFSVVREMVGHGIGHNMHESPEVPNYGRHGHGVKLQEGMVICIEPSSPRRRRTKRRTRCFVNSVYLSKTLNATKVWQKNR